MNPNFTYVIQGKMVLFMRFLLTDILIKQLKLSQLPKSKMINKLVTDLNGKDVFESFVRCMLYFNIITFQNVNNKNFSKGMLCWQYHR